MDRYYKIAKDSETGKKLAELVERVFDFKYTRNEFFKKYGIKKYRLYDMFLVSVDSVFLLTNHQSIELTGKKKVITHIFQRRILKTNS